MSMDNKHQYVDLGLSVNWATCNVDAEKPEDYGGLYAWGETKTKRNYSWFKYKYNKWRFVHGLEIFKYSGYYDKKTILEQSDDVANVKWGGDWRMPTGEEFEELRKNCTWIWTEVNGIAGYKVISNKSGYSDRYIFLPAAGYGDGKNWCGTGGQGNYWSSSLNDFYLCDRALYLHFSKEGNHTELYRNEGLTIRPVCPSNSWNVKFKSKSIIIKENDIYKLNVEDNDNNIIDWFKIKWTSDDSSVVIVDDYGRISGLSVGNAIITAKVKNKIVSCHIEVVATNKVAREKTKYVDLGLSVKWATCNLGASAPETYGNYYSWGELRTKTTYSIVNYKYRQSGYVGEDIKYLKYNNIDKKTVLDLSDDVAQMKLGGSWRIPTTDEWDELERMCKWELYTLNGIDGFVVTSTKTGYTDRSIFLPKGGYYKEGNLKDANYKGYYWASTLFNRFNSQNTAEIYQLDEEFCLERLAARHWGLTIRPVCQ